MSKIYDKLPSNLIREIALFQEIEDLNNFLKTNQFNKNLLSGLIQEKLKFSPFIAWKKLKSLPDFSKYKSIELKNLPELLLKDEHKPMAGYGSGLVVSFSSCLEKDSYKKIVFTAIFNKYFGFMDFLFQNNIKINILYEEQEFDLEGPSIFHYYTLLDLVYNKVDFETIQFVISREGEAKEENLDRLMNRIINFLGFIEEKHSSELTIDLLNEKIMAQKLCLSIFSKINILNLLDSKNLHVLNDISSQVPFKIEARFLISKIYKLLPGNFYLRAMTGLFSHPERIITLMESLIRLYNFVQKEYDPSDNGIARQDLNKIKKKLHHVLKSEYFELLNHLDSKNEVKSMGTEMKLSCFNSIQEKYPISGTDNDSLEPLLSPSNDYLISMPTETEISSPVFLYLKKILDKKNRLEYQEPKIELSSLETLGSKLIFVLSFIGEPFILSQGIALIPNCESAAKFFSEGISRIFFKDFFTAIIVSEAVSALWAISEFIDWLRKGNEEILLEINEESLLLRNLRFSLKLICSLSSCVIYTYSALEDGYDHLLTIPANFYYRFFGYSILFDQIIHQTKLLGNPYYAEATKLRNDWNLKLQLAAEFNINLPDTVHTSDDFIKFITSISINKNNNFKRLFLKIFSLVISLLPTIIVFHLEKNKLQKIFHDNDIESILLTIFSETPIFVLTLISTFDILKRIYNLIDLSRCSFGANDICCSIFKKLLSLSFLTCSLGAASVSGYVVSDKLQYSVSNQKLLIISSASVAIAKICFYNFAFFQLFDKVFLESFFCLDRWTDKYRFKKIYKALSKAEPCFFNSFPQKININDSKKYPSKENHERKTPCFRCIIS